MREVALYDPNRKPASWMELIQPPQYAVFFSEVESGVELTSDGRHLGPGMTHSCLIFDSLEEAEKYCRQKIEDIPKLRCDVFDSSGRVNSPVATLVGGRYQGRLQSPAKSTRMMQWAFLSMAASLPLFWYTWHTRGEEWMAAFFGVQLVVVGLRLLHWGYGMKEELRHRKVQSDLRKQENVNRS